MRRELRELLSPPPLSDAQGREGKLQKELTFNQPNVAGTGPLRRLLRVPNSTAAPHGGAQHGASHRTAVKEVFDAGLIPNEPEPLSISTCAIRCAVDISVSSDRPPPRGSPGGRHIRMGITRNEAVGLSRGFGSAGKAEPKTVHGRRELSGKSEYTGPARAQRLHRL